mgnify:CR=1 FL=1
MTNLQLFNSLDSHLLTDAKPKEYIDKISVAAEFAAYPFSMLLRLKHTKQSKKYHPEGSVWIHTLLAVNQAAMLREISKSPRVLMWAALLHDIGKPDTTVITKEKVGAKLAGQFLSYFKCDEDFISNVASLIRWHMQVLFVNKNSKYANLEKATAQTDANELALLSYCDRMGRAGAEGDAEEKNIQQFLNKVNIIKNKDKNMNI